MVIMRKNSKSAAAEKFVSDRKGSTAIAMAILLPFMIAGLAFGSEVGYWELTKRKLQNAADTAAFAAATQLRSGLDQSDFENAALTVGNDSGFTFTLYDPNTPGQSGALRVESPPTRGGYAGDDDAIMVSVNTIVPRRFTKLFLQNDISLNAFATAEVRNPRPACVLALDPTASAAVLVDGSTDVTLTGCDVAANSISNAAFTQSGSGQIETECISTVGGVSINGTVGSDPDTSDVALTDTAECPEPKENAPVTADPYRNRPEPVVPVDCATNPELRELTPNNNQTGNPLPTWESPTGNNLGKAYCIGNTEIIHGTVNFAPGVYVIKCTGNNPPCTLQVNATASLIGTGVTLYLTDNVVLDLRGGATVDLHAPTPNDVPAPATSDYYGLVIYFARNNTHTSQINGGANFNLVGAVYGADAHIEFNGSGTGSNPGECTQIIAGTVTFTGASDFDTDCSASGTTDIVTALSIALVE